RTTFARIASVKSSQFPRRMCGEGTIRSVTGKTPGLAESSSLLFHSCPADLDVYGCSGCALAADVPVQQQREGTTRLCALLVVVDHENDFFANDGHRPRSDRYHQAARLRRQPCLGTGHPGALCQLAISVPDRL